MYWIGLQAEGSSLKWAKLRRKNNKIQIEQLRTVSLEEGENINPLYISQNLKEKHSSRLISGIRTEDILLRELDLPIQDKRKIIKLLPFQIESQIPYAPEEGVIGVQIFPSKTTKKAQVSLFATKVSSLTSHIDFWKQYQIEPDEISCIPVALWRFAQHFFPNLTQGLILHMGYANSTAVYFQEGKVVFSHSFSLGSEPFFKALQKETNKLPPSQYLDLYTDPRSSLYEPAKTIQQEIDRLFSFLLQKLEKPWDTVLLTGHFSTFPKLKDFIALHLPGSMTLLSEPSLHTSYDATTLEGYAIPIGLSLDALMADSQSVSFRQDSFLANSTKKRIVKYFSSYAIAASILFVVGLFFSHRILEQKEKLLIERFSLCSGETNLQIHSLEELETKLLSAEARLGRNKLPYPLDPQTPTVSEILAWLSGHPALAIPGLEIFSIKYNLVQHPSLTSPKHPYKGKVVIQMEATQSIPDTKILKKALLDQISLIDETKEFIWETKESIHTLSFFLKYKTGPVS